jgi:hypothetical protein
MFTASPTAQLPARSSNLPRSSHLHQEDTPLRAIRSHTRGDHPQRRKASRALVANEKKALYNEKKALYTGQKKRENLDLGAISPYNATALCDQTTHC